MEEEGEVEEARFCELRPVCRLPTFWKEDSVASYTYKMGGWVASVTMTSTYSLSEGSSVTARLERGGKRQDEAGGEVTRGCPKLTLLVWFEEWKGCSCLLTGLSF